ncbi:MAG: MFS transporter [Verrucomicrobia bacterium]|nr:MFS transporter [Verrucomicrobiota bacterium]
MTAPLSKSASLWVLFVAFAGLVCAGVQLGLMPLAALSVAKSLLGDAFTPGLAGDWFARYTAAMMLGGAFGGIALGALGDRIGRARATGVCVLLYSLAGGAGAFVTSQEQLLALRFLAGFGVGGMWPNGVALVAESWANASRPMVAGIAGTGLNVGIFCVSQLGRAKQVTPESWRWLLELSGTSVLLGLVALFLVPESPKWLAARRSSRGNETPSNRERKDTDGGWVKVSLVTSTATRSPLSELFRPPLLRRTLIGIALGAIPLIGAWAASKWMIPWADAVGGTAHSGLKANTQQWWALGAILGSFFGAHLANLLGRRVTYFLISLGSVTLTCGIFGLLKPLDVAFLPLVFAQGFVSTLFFGWLPLYLPELFPTRVRATGAGIAYNSGRFISSVGIFAAGAFMAWSGGDYARVGVVTGLIYALGMVVVWWAPDTGGKPLED